MTRFRPGSPRDLYDFTILVRHLPSAGRVLFLSASPHTAGSAVLLRADLFAPARLNFRRDLAQPALNLDLPHGLSLRLAGSANVFVLHSLAANQIWVFAARLLGDHDDNAIGGCLPTVDLMKCAVIDLVLPIYAVAVSMGSLLLSEVDWVRVFPLRPLIKRKGRVASHNDLGEKTDTERTRGELLDFSALSLVL